VTSKDVKQDAPFATAAIRQVLRATKGQVLRLKPRFGGRMPDRLIIAPQDIRTSDATLALDMLAGRFSFGGRTVDVNGRNPFTEEMPTPIYAQELFGLSWLRHFKTLPSPAERRGAASFVQHWLTASGARRSAIARRPDVAARRLISLIAHAPIILDGADSSFYAAVIRAINEDAKLLWSLRGSLPPDDSALLVQTALTHYAVAALEEDRQLKDAALLLCDALEEQILSDGGHVSRNPAVILQVLIDLLPLKLAFLWRRIQTPQPIISAIDRMLPMVRMMRHTDGSLALFNGMGATRMDQIATILAQDDTKSSALRSAPYSGYQRAQHGASILIQDTGAAPRPPLAGHAHAAPGAFEFSTEGGRLVVNCGAPPAHRPDWRDMARTTAAHSTLIIDDALIGRFPRSPMTRSLIGSQYVGGASVVEPARADGADGTLLSFQHNGYAKSHALLHERRLALSADGLVLEGEDVLSPGGSTRDYPFTLRFHLHPGVQAESEASGASVRLTLPNRQVWRFEAHGLPVAVEASLFFASPEGHRPTRQLVVEGSYNVTPSVSWSFQRISAGA
jgi:uncharacterized heparinase superfamily protein